MGKITTWLEAILHRVRGTLSIVAVLVVVFLLEVVVQTAAGYESVQAALNAPGTGVKTLLGVVGGPYLHQSAERLIGNLGVILLTASYVESRAGDIRLYQFYVATGFLGAVAAAATQLPGAVGASGAAYGFTGWMLIQGTATLGGVYETHKPWMQPLHALPVLYASVKIYSGIQPLLLGVAHPGDVAHVTGACIGMLYGAVRIYRA